MVTLSAAIEIAELPDSGDAGSVLTGDHAIRPKILSNRPIDRPKRSNRAIRQISESVLMGHRTFLLVSIAELMTRIRDELEAAEASAL